MQPATTLAAALAAARETRDLRIAPGAIHETAAIFIEQFGQVPAVIVADKTTCAAAGEKAAQAFRDAGHPMLPSYLFDDPNLYAEYGFVEELEKSLRQHKAIPVAVGSGTINDLTKLAAHNAGRPYLCVATAASMDGYTAFGASITYQGSKQTFECPAPAAVIADVDIIAAAPPEMNAWGYADLIAKATAGADWLLADALGIEPIEPGAWDLVQGNLRAAVDDPAGIRSGDRAAIGRLVEGLMFGGFAMQSTRSSRPASGAEHQFSHLWDMQHHTHLGHVPSHGLKVGIGTLAITALYERILELPLEELDVERCCTEWKDEEAWAKRADELLPEKELRAVALREIAAKQSSVPELRNQLALLKAAWPQLRGKLRNQLIPFVTLKQMLAQAGAVFEPEQIGISRERLRESFWQAFFIRRRFTVLDLAVRAGVLDQCLGELFGSSGQWPANKSPQ